MLKTGKIGAGNGALEGVDVGEGSGMDDGENVGMNDGVRVGGSVLSQSVIAKVPVTSSPSIPSNNM